VRIISTYRAVQAVSPGRLELTQKTLQAPGPGKVRIRVEACGVCHSNHGITRLREKYGRACRGGLLARRGAVCVTARSL